MFKTIKCIAIAFNIGKSTYDKFCNIKKRWKQGYRKSAVAECVITIAKTSCTSIVLYDPWILTRPLLMLVPIAVQYIPFVGTLVIVKTIIIYGIEFIT
jgi:hypothetical protein